MAWCDFNVQTCTLCPKSWSGYGRNKKGISPEQVFWTAVMRFPFHIPYIYSQKRGFFIDVLTRQGKCIKKVDYHYVKAKFSQTVLNVEVAGRVF